MKRLVLIVMITLFGSIGWWFGDALMSKFLFSVVGSVAGVVVAWKLNLFLGS